MKKTTRKRSVSNRENGYRSGSSSRHESYSLQPHAVYVLFYLGRRSAFHGQRSRITQVFSSTGIHSHSARYRGSTAAPLRRGLHRRRPLEESETQKSELNLKTELLLVKYSVFLLLCR